MGCFQVLAAVTSPNQSLLKFRAAFGPNYGMNEVSTRFQEHWRLCLKLAFGYPAGRPGSSGPLFNHLDRGGYKAGSTDPPREPFGAPHCSTRSDSLFSAAPLPCWEPRIPCSPCSLSLWPCHPLDGWVEYREWQMPLTEIKQKMFKMQLFPYPWFHILWFRLPMVNCGSKIFNEKFHNK